MSLFDNIQAAVFSAIQTVFGDTAVWIPSDDSETVTANVLFKNPNDPISIGETDKYTYRPYDYSIEYYKGQFQNLKELVDSGSLEVVTVKGYDLIIREVRCKFDGQTLTAYGEER